MKIHYLPRRGNPIFIDGVLHLQNVDDEHLCAYFENGRELVLNIHGIEGIVDSSVFEKEKYHDKEGLQEAHQKTLDLLYPAT